MSAAVTSDGDSALTGRKGHSIYVHGLFESGGASLDVSAGYTE